MKSFKDFPKISLGSSETASLTVRSEHEAKIVYFGEPGEHSAHLVDEPADIGPHYGQVFSARDWIRIYDDNGLTRFIEAEEIYIYRASETGCIIQLFGKK